MSEQTEGPQNFLEYYAATWSKPLAWAERRLDFLERLAGLLSEPGMADAFREWTHDREKMLQTQGRSAGIASADYAYYQGAAVEIGMLVDNWQEDLSAYRAGQKLFAETQEEPKNESP